MKLNAFTKAVIQSATAATATAFSGADRPRRLTSAAAAAMLAMPCSASRRPGQVVGESDHAERSDRDRESDGRRAAGKQRGQHKPHGDRRPAAAWCRNGM
jgi:hypothetical protein